MFNIKYPLRNILSTLSITKEQREDLKYYIENPKVNPYNFIEYITDYLFEIKYSQDNIDYDYANKYFKSRHGNTIKSACSSVYSNGYLFRNLDWNYSNDSDFVMITNRNNGRFKSIGVASCANLDNDFVKSGQYSDKYKILPFCMTDGVNENGVAASINVVPKDFGHTNQNLPVKKDMCALMLIRYILDYATSAEQICNDIKNNLNIYCPKENEFHFLVGDTTGAYCIEFIDNETIVTELEGDPFITNFHIEGTEIVNDEIKWDSISNYGTGVERYQYLLDNYPFNNLTSIKSCLNNLLFTKAYTETTNPWLTEFVGKYKDYDLTVLDAKNNPSKFNDILTKARNAYNNRTREDGKTWQTVHSSIYDLANKKLYIGVQENPVAYSFDLTNDYTIL